MPRNLNDSTAVTVLFMMVSGGRAGGFLLKYTSRLITVLNEVDHCGVVCKLQELDRGVFRCAVVVEAEEQWGENTALRSLSTDSMGAGCVFSQPH